MRSNKQMASHSYNPLRHVPLVFAVCAIALFLLPPVKGQSQAAQATSPNRTPVLVELFTSEGCSDCPPADAILTKLDAEQFVQGADAIVLSEHVTYWNHQGWNDPFSLNDVDQRQDDYVQQFKLPSPATPQFVVDGAAQVAGADPRKLILEISSAAVAPKPAVQIEDAHRASDGSIDFTVKADLGTKANLVAAVAENATQSSVAGGENAGRTLHNVAVVRALKDFGSNAADGRPLKLAGTNVMKAEKDGEPIRLVVFFVNHSNGHVVALAEQTLAQ
jgi:hypothetical protein